MPPEPLHSYVETGTRGFATQSIQNTSAPAPLRDPGWGEDQIAEGVTITAMFAFFNRGADAFGIPPQNYLATGRMTS